MKKTKYNPLPQFSESDSDIDIFNAKPQAQAAPRLHEKRPKQPVKFCFVVLIIVAIVTTITIVLSIRKHGKKEVKLNVKVSTDCGPVLGYHETVSVDGKVVTTHVYKGIPYAQPPVGNLRWNPPVELTVNNKNCWSGILNASQAGSKCVQGKNVGLEDCLYLNVHSPVSEVISHLPVFVWIHGGSLMVGDGDQKGYSPDSEFVAAMNVVSVSMNYRLNAFGFLSLKELWQKDKSYGNYGLMDQILALKWIQRNIKNFGGDPNSVTICGQSSGGTSIFGLLASPMADGLFHKAIPMSGSPKFEKSYKDAAKENRVFLNSTKCKLMTSKENRRDCLLNLTTEEIINAIPWNVYPYWAMRDLLDFPTKNLIDGALIIIDSLVLVNAPKNLSQNTFPKQSKIPVLIGNTAQEIGYDPLYNFSSWSSFQTFLKNRTDPFSPKVFQKLWNDLYKNKSSTINAQFLYETMSTDVRLTCPTSQLARDFMKSKQHVIFRYVVEHSTYRPVVHSDHTSHNAYHSIDANALFGFKYESETGYKLNNDDINFMRTIRASFLQFIKTGSPPWKSGQTGVYNQHGQINVLRGDYHSKQCAYWSDKANGFVPYAWIN